MASQSIPIRIPLLGISGKVKQEEAQTKELPQGLKRISEVEISISQSLPEACYALEIPNFLKESGKPGMAMGIFGFEKDIAALNDIHAFGLEGQEPFVCKVIKSDAQAGSPNLHAKNSRKSFMTPTPLHIPESRISPIPDSSHEMIYLKGLNDKEALKVIPLREVVWMHPLVSVVENPSK